MKDVTFTPSVADQLPYLDIAQALRIRLICGDVRVELQIGSSREISAAT
ncbi:hypothetical protein ABK730_03065 [Klebsiella indica]|nr:hypothetical protein [Klebsiella indica]